MRGLLGAANGYDVIIATLVFCGVVVTALVTLYGARQAREAKRSSHRTEEQMRPANGERTADSIYELRKQVSGLVVSAGQLVAGQARLEGEARDHRLRDDERFDRDERRFGAVFTYLGVDDPEAPTLED